MKLSELLNYKKVYIQCHDNPDADAIASAFGLFRYFRSRNVDTMMIYGGRNQISKPNLKLMLELLEIPLNYIPESFTIVDGLLLTVDCQYGQGNVTPLQADSIAIIDHHQKATTIERSEIHSYLASCSTLVWSMLNEEGYDIESDDDLCTALYYGLMTDSNNFLETLHPMDRDMHDSLPYDNNLITRFINSNISIKELEIAGIALIRHIYNDDHRFAIIHSDTCDPNILGLISDLVVQVDKIDTCVVYNNTDGGFKLSVRACTKEVRANELVEFLTEGIGSGGGHKDKAGGFIFENMYESLYPTINTETYFGLRMTKYFDEIEIIYAKDYSMNISDAKRYEKLYQVMSYVHPVDFIPYGTNITIRTFASDTITRVRNSLYLVFNVNGEVKLTKKAHFEKLYKDSEGEFICKAEYFPTIKSNFDNSTIDFAEHLKSCEYTEGNRIYAKKLEKPVKVFSLWDKSNYELGNPGDYIACKDFNHSDVFIIKKDELDKYYKEIE